MKNREKFAKEILDIACKGNRIAVKHNSDIPCVCNNIECEECLFDLYDDCKEGLENWCESEYVEKPTITSREKAFLDLLLSKWKYIVRNKDAILYVFDEMPKKESDYWRIKDISGLYNHRDIFGDMFAFIKWEDEEPWSIEDLKKLEVKDENSTK